MNHQRILRFGLAAAVAAAVSVPVVSRALRAQQPPPVPAPAAPTSLPATRPVDPNKVVIQVGDEKLTAAQFDAFVADLPEQEQAFVRGRGRRQFADYLVRTKLLAAEAQRRKLQDTPKFKRQLDFVREQILATIVAGDVQQMVDDAAVKKYFEEHKPELERIAARHVLIRSPGSAVPLRPGQKEQTEEQAKAKADEVVKRLKAGEDFAKVAKAESDDVSSGAEGGDLGSFTRGRMVPQFEQTAFALKEGEISAPLKTQFGWHVIQVTGRYDTLDKLGDAAKTEIRSSLAPQKLNDLIKTLQQNGKVAVDETYLGPPAPPEAEQGPPVLGDR